MRYEDDCVPIPNLKRQVVHAFHLKILVANCENFINKLYVGIDAPLPNRLVAHTFRSSNVSRAGRENVRRLKIDNCIKPAVYLPLGATQHCAIQKNFGMKACANFQR